MPTSRTYGDACGIARALDVVGERWALLVVRELFLGPQRYSDLRRALPGASSNLLADRLRELEGRGVIDRRLLPAPAASHVYELTAWGAKLEPIVLALGGWGLEVPIPQDATLSATSVLLHLRGAARPDPATPAARYRIAMGDRVWTARTRRGRVEIDPGEPGDPVAGLSTDPQTLNAILADPSRLDTANARVTGDRGALTSLLRSVSAPAR